MEPSTPIIETDIYILNLINNQSLLRRMGTLKAEEAEERKKDSRNFLAEAK